MESDLKSLQKKISDLEGKLSFTHTALEDDTNSVANIIKASNKNVHFDTNAFYSLTNDAFNMSNKLSEHNRIESDHGQQLKHKKNDSDDE